MNEKITDTQLGLLLLPLVLATEVLSVPAYMAGYAKQSAWLSVIPSMLVGFWTVWVMLALAKRYPGLSLIQYSEKILGKWAGKAVGAYLIYSFFLLASEITEEHASFLDTVALPTTPTIVESGTIIAISAYAVFCGIETIARCGQFVVPFNVLGFGAMFLLTFQVWDFARMLPFFDGGIGPILKGSATPSAWMGELYMLGFLIPYLNSEKSAKKPALWAVVGIAVIMMVTNVQSTLVLGNLTAKLTFPAFEVVRYVSIADFLERLDPVMVAIWIFGGFLKETLVLFVFCLCVSQTFELKNYRSVLLPLAMVTVIGAQTIFPNSTEEQQFSKFTWPLIAVINQNLFPTFLLLFDSLKKKWKGVHT